MAKGKAMEPVKDYRLFSTEVAAWAALRTSARWEKKIAEQLIAAGVPAYLPLIERVTQYKGKKVSLEIPMFSGYIFCSAVDFIDNPRIPKASRAKVAQIIRPTHDGQLRDELSQIAHVLTNHGLVQERMFGQPGEVVHILRGPLKGLEGLIVQLKPKRRQLLLRVSMLGTRLEVDISEDWIGRE